MTARKTLLLTAATALVSVPVWGASSQAVAHGPSATPPGQLKDADEHATTHGAPAKPSHPAGSHKCKPHGVAFILTGVLGATPTLTKNGDGTYNTEVTLKEVTHTNHHAKGAKDPYTLTNVHVTFGASAPKEGDRVKLIGKVTTIAKKCDHSTFSATITIRKVVFSAPDTH